jgi:hypothetical protein
MMEERRPSLICSNKFSRKKSEHEGKLTVFFGAAASGNLYA